MPNDGEVWAPNKRSLIWLGDIYALLDSDVVARTELRCQGELQCGNQPIMHPWPQCRMFQIGIHTWERTGHRRPPLVLLQTSARLVCGATPNRCRASQSGDFLHRYAPALASNPLLSASVIAISMASEYGL